MTDKLVSFIIAAHNEEKYVTQCIDSCLSQSYRPVEVCITDDGSTDGTFKCLNYYKDDARVKVAQFPENRGKVAAFNNSFKMATGYYIAIMGADDLCEPDRIKVSVEKIGDSGLVFGDMVKINEAGLVTESDIMSKRFGVTRDTVVDFDRLLRAPCVFGGTIMGRTDIFNRIFPLNEFLGHEDWWIPLKASTISKVVYIDYPLIRYRQHQGQTTGRLAIRNLEYQDWLKLRTRNIPYYSAIKREFDLTVSQAVVVENNLKDMGVYENKVYKRIFSLIKIFLYRLPTGGQIVAAFHPRLLFFLRKFKLFLSLDQKIN